MKLLVVAITFMWQVSAAAAGTDECDFLAQPDNKFWKAGDRPVTWLECRDLTDNSRNNGKPLTVRQLEEVRGKYARDRNYSPDNLWNAVSAASMRTKTDCMIASSDIKMCTCLAEELPVDLSYLNYVLLISSPKMSDLNHLNWKPYELERLYVDVRSVRDMCVARDRLPGGRLQEWIKK